MKRCVTTTHLDVLKNSQGVLGKHTLFKSVKKQFGHMDTLIECLSFYKNLYTKKLTDGQHPSINQYFFPELGDVHFSKAEETSCEGPLTETECLSSLKQISGRQQNSWDRRSTSRVLQIVLERYFRRSYLCALHTTPVNYQLLRDED